MGYVDKNLISGEQVTYRSGLHWIVLVGPFMVAVVLGILGAIMLVEGHSAAQPRLGQFSEIAGGLAILIFVIYLLIAVLVRRSAEFAVTNERVIFKMGMVRRRAQEIFLEKIESVTVGEGVLGRTLNYGTIVIRGTGGTLEPFDKIAHAQEFRRHVQEQISKKL